MSDAERPEDTLPENEAANDLTPDDGVIDGDVEQGLEAQEPAEDAILPEESVEEPEASDLDDQSELDDAPPETDESLPESAPMAEADQEAYAAEEDQEVVHAPPVVPASPPSAEVFQQRQRSLPALAVGALLVALGVIFVWPVFSGGYILIREVILAITIGGIALSLLAYWLYTGRKARGALFLALLGLFWAGFTGMMIFDIADLSLVVDWPLYIVLSGLSIVLATMGDSFQDKRLITPGIILVITGGAALAYTRDVVPKSILDGVADYWPWIALVIVIGMLPLAIRRVPKND